MRPFTLRWCLGSPFLMAVRQSSPHIQPWQAQSPSPVLIQASRSRMYALPGSRDSLSVSVASHPPQRTGSKHQRRAVTSSKHGAPPKEQSSPPDLPPRGGATDSILTRSSSPPFTHRYRSRHESHGRRHASGARSPSPLTSTPLAYTPYRTRPHNPALQPTRFACG